MLGLGLMRNSDGLSPRSLGVSEVVLESVFDLINLEFIRNSSFVPRVARFDVYPSC